MIVKVNAIEVASDLAHQATYDEQKDIIVDENDLFDGENYKEEHQEVFNRHYDYFFEILTNAGIEEESVGIKTKKFIIHSEHNVFEDDFVEGEGKNVNNYSQKATIEAPNIKSAIAKYFENELFCNDFNWEYAQVNEDGKYVHYSFLVDAENSQASESEKENWCNKKKVLYSNNITLWVEGVTELLNLKINADE